jgi:hypothetical protein
MAITLLPACDVTIKDGNVSFQETRGRATRQFSKSYPIGPKARVEIVNTSGDIEVGVGPAEWASVEATMSARAMTDERAKEVLAEAKIDEQAVPEHVKLTTSRGGRSGGFEVDYELTVPVGARVELTTNNGELKANGLTGHLKGIVTNGAIEMIGHRGSVDVASVNGHVVVRMAEVNDRVRIEATNGRITLEVPKNTKATLNARSVNGSITVSGLNTPEASGRRIRTVESQINGGGPELDVRVTNGRINIEGK